MIKICRRRHSPSHRGSAFTLVELLVVIGIITVLIAILLPGLNNARESARLTACLSNVRQLGMAMNMYVGEYKGAWPRYYVKSAGGKWVDSTLSTSFAWGNDGNWATGYP